LSSPFYDYFCSCEAAVVEFLEIIRFLLLNYFNAAFYYYFVKLILLLKVLNGLTIYCDDGGFAVCIFYCL